MNQKSLGVVGIVLWALGVLGGGFLFLLLFVLPGIAAPDPAAHFLTMAEACALAFPACAVYMLVPLIVDRYEPEPVWALAMVFIWGAVAAIGFSGLINTINGILGQIFGLIVTGGSRQGASFFGRFVGAVISAPLVEEAFKGAALLGIFWFARKEFDGVVDGVIYAVFVALGFAATENVHYYTRAAAKGAAGMGTLFFIRGILTPWLHPLFTSMTGLGVGLARETNKTWLKWAAPFLGYCAAVFLHAVWNGVATVIPLSLAQFALFVVPVWLIFVAIFGIIVLLLVRREGLIIRRFLKDEVLMGTLTQRELDLVCSPFGRIQAMFGAVPGGRKFVDVACRLGLSKWHTARAMQGQKQTISADFLVPLRQEIYALKAKHGRRPHR